MQNVGDVAALVAAHSWIALAALIVFAIVRLLKSDTKIPLNIPARYRPVLAIALGAVAGVLDHVASGTPWRQALVNGATAGVLAIMGNVLGVDVLRDGVDVPVPKGISVPPPPMPEGGTLAIHFPPATKPVDAVFIPDPLPSETTPVEVPHPHREIDITQNPDSDPNPFGSRGPK